MADDDPDKSAKPSKSLDAADIALLKTYVRGAARLPRPPCSRRERVHSLFRVNPARAFSAGFQGAGPYAARIKALENALEEELKVRREAAVLSARAVILFASPPLTR